MHITHIQLFQTTKIQIFESNSQRHIRRKCNRHRCFRLQRYKFLKAIHNWWRGISSWTWLFQTTKIQIFESNSQRKTLAMYGDCCCFRLQRYKFLKAIHNHIRCCCFSFFVVSDYKDTNFWKQFTTSTCRLPWASSLFQTTKIQIFESNSQRRAFCLRCLAVVSDYKDTNFWKQFTTAWGGYAEV